MTKLRLDIPAYNKATLDFMNEVIKGLWGLDGILSKIPSRPTVHSGPIRNVRGSQPLDQPMAEIEHQLNIHFDVIRHTNIDAFVQILYDFAVSYKKMIIPSMLSQLSSVIDAVGNTIDVKEQDFSLDIWLDALEKISIDFDEVDQPIMPTIVMPPNFPKEDMEMTAEQSKRFQQILERKRSEYHAQDRTRRLS